MGNADKVSLKKEVDLFLGNMKIKQGNENSAYNLDEEFSKTKKNKSRFISIMIICCVVFTTLASIGVFCFVSMSNDKIKININSFDDLNLRSLLSMVGRSEAKYDSALRELSTIENEYNDSIAQLESDKAGDLQVLDSVKSIISAKKMKENRFEVDEKYRKKREELNAEYSEKLKSAEAEVARWQKEVEKYDSGKLEKAHKEESVIDSQKQLHDLEVKSLIKKYEARISVLRRQSEEQLKKAQRQQKAAVEEVRRIYQARIDQLDPLILNDSKGDEINVQFKNISPDFDKVSGNLPESERIAEYVKIARESLSDFDYVSDVVAKIPQENSIPSYVNAMRNLTFNTIESMVSGAEKLQQQIESLENDLEAKDREIESVENKLEYANDFLENYILAGIFDAFILERNIDYEYEVFVAKGKKILFEDESKKYPCVLYDEKKPYATGTVYSREGKYFATLVKSAKAKEFIIKNGYRLIIGEEILEQ